GGADMVAAAEHQGAGVGEVARELGLDAADGPLLQHVGEQLTVGHGHPATGGTDRLDVSVAAVEEPDRPGLTYAGEGERCRLAAPLADERQGGHHVPGG